MLGYRKIHITILVLLLIAALDYYGLRLIQGGSILSLFAKIFPLIIALTSLFFAFQTKLFLFNRAVKLLLIAMFFSTIMAFVSWNQNWLDTVRITLHYMLIGYVFYLQKVNMDVKTIEKWLLIFGLIYSLFYFLQLATPGNVLFGNHEITESRGSLRFVLPGYGFYIITTFIAFILFSDKTSKNYLFWGLIAIVGLVITVLQVTRQNIAAVMIILSIHFLKNTPNKRKISIMWIIGLFCIWFFYFDNPIYKGLSEAVKTTSTNVDIDIRVLAAQYFIKDYSPQTINRIFGNGVSQGTKSDFGEYNIYLAEVLRVDMSDVGFFGFYAMFGLFGIIGYLMIWYTSVKYPLPRRYYYLKYFLWYIFLTGFTSYALIRIDMFIVTTLVIYMYQKVYQEHYLLLTVKTAL